MWTCATCGESHEGLATVFGADAPESWMTATWRQRRRGELGADQCIVTLDGTTHYFIRGHVQIPIVDTDEVFAWSVWCSPSGDSMRTTAEHWDDPQRDQLPPMFGWLNTALPYREPTLSIPTHVHTRAPGSVPLIELDPGIDHELVREQQEGITWHRVGEINATLLGTGA